MFKRLFRPSNLRVSKKISLGSTLKKHLPQISNSAGDCGPQISNASMPPDPSPLLPRPRSPLGVIRTSYELQRARIVSRGGCTWSKGSSSIRRSLSMRRWRVSTWPSLRQPRPGNRLSSMHPSYRRSSGSAQTRLPCTCSPPKLWRRTNSGAYVGGWEMQWVRLSVSMVDRKRVGGGDRSCNESYRFRGVNE